METINYENWFIDREADDFIENIWDLKEDDDKMEEVPKYEDYEMASWYLAPEDPELIEDYLPQS